MNTLFVRDDGIPCRGCGATQGAPIRDKVIKGCCQTCLKKFKSWCGQRKIEHTANNFNAWLARQLFLNARRLKVFGITGRCEAITVGNGALYLEHCGPQGGYQCGSPATDMRDGRRVCASHREATEPKFICEAITTPYDDFSRLVAELSLCDPQFLQSIRDGLAAAEDELKTRKAS